MELEEKYYGPDSSEAEIELLRGRVTILKDNVLLWHEVPKPSVFQVGVFGRKLEELTSDLESFYLVSDLTEAERPNAEVRKAIADVMAEHTKIAHTASFLGGNLILRVALRFVFAQGGWHDWSVGKDLDDCLSIIDKLKNGRTEADGQG
jgi:hypothetical protein